MGKERVKLLLGLLGWFGIVWGIIFLIVVGGSHFITVNDQDSLFGLPVFNVKDYKSVFLFGAPSVISLFIYGIFRKRVFSSK